MKIRTYKELIRLETFEERFDYLKLNGSVGRPTFAFDRYLNQRFYKSPEWNRVRSFVISRDLGCDLGIRDREIFEGIIVHHMNPISIEELRSGDSLMLNPDFMISTSSKTHLAIHYGDKDLLRQVPIERKPNDTIPWR